MAGLTKEQRAAKNAALIAEAEAQKASVAELVAEINAVDDGLCAMTKDGETLRVHPTCVKSHQSAGWKVA